MSLKPLLSAGAVLAAFALVLVLSGTDVTRAGTFNPKLEVTLDSTEPNQPSNFKVDFGVETGDVNFAAVVAYIPKEWGVVLGKDIPIGAVVGKLTSTATLGLINSACNTALPVEFTFFNSSLDLTDTVSFYDDEADDDTTPEFAEDNEPKDGLPDAVDKYPEFITRVLDDISGPEVGNPLQPIRRSAGTTVVAGTAVLLQFLLFNPGTVINDALPSDPELGYPSVTLLQNLGDPEIVPAPGPITDFCTPLVSANTSYGRTLSCTATPSSDQTPTPPPCQNLFVNPLDGKYTFTVVSFGQRDADDDGYENSFDTCSLVANQGDPRIPNSGDDDGDGLDAACDPNDKDINSDEDLDGYSNRGDNCPLDANGQDLDNQKDSDTDQIGDACDPEPNSANGELAFSQVTQDVSIGTGSGPGGTPVDFKPGSGGGGGGDDTGLIVGIIVGVAAAVIVVGGGAYFLMRRGGGAA